MWGTITLNKSTRTNSRKVFTYFGTSHRAVGGDGWNIFGVRGGNPMGHPFGLQMLGSSISQAAAHRQAEL